MYLAAEPRDLIIVFDPVSSNLSTHGVCPLYQTTVHKSQELENPQYEIINLIFFCSYFYLTTRLALTIFNSFLDANLTLQFLER